MNEPSNNSAKLFSSRASAPAVARLADNKPTIFAEMTTLAHRFQAVNLGQGFPDEDGPRQMLEVATQEILGGNNQYGPARGIGALRRAIAADRQRRLQQTFNPDTEIAVSVGATEAIAATVLSMVEASEHVIVIEPFYDAYVAAINLAGAEYTAVPLRYIPADSEQPLGTGDEGQLLGGCWRLDEDALADAVLPHTAMIIVNTPHNPTGHIFTRGELEAISKVAVKHDLIVLADEVYEHLIFDGAQHVPVASIDGLAERTMTVSSAAKTFNATGWKTGWMMGPAPLVTAAVAAKQYMSFVGATPLQPAVAYGINECQDWIEQLSETLTRRRNYLASELSKLGFDVFPCQGTYFLTTDVRRVTAKWGHPEMSGEEFCAYIPEHCGVAAVPVTALADNEPEYRYMVRWTFCKPDDVLHEAISRLSDASSRLS